MKDFLKKHAIFIVIVVILIVIVIFLSVNYQKKVKNFDCKKTEAPNDDAGEPEKIDCKNDFFSDSEIELFEKYSNKEITAVEAGKQLGISYQKFIYYYGEWKNNGQTA